MRRPSIEKIERSTGPECLTANSTRAPWIRGLGTTERSRHVGAGISPTALVGVATTSTRRGGWPPSLLTYVAGLAAVDVSANDTWRSASAITLAVTFAPRVPS